MKLTKIILYSVLNGVCFGALGIAMLWAYGNLMMPN